MSYLKKRHHKRISRYTLNDQNFTHVQLIHHAQINFTCSDNIVRARTTRVHGWATHTLHINLTYNLFLLEFIHSIFHQLIFMK